MSDSLLFTVLVPAMISAILAWWAWLTALHGLPAQDRRWHDPLPPLWRWTWPLIRLMARPLQAVLSDAMRHKTLQQLRQADLDRTLDAEQWWAGCVVAALLTAGLVSVGVSMLNQVFIAQGAGPMIAAGKTGGVAAMAALVGVLLPLMWRRERRAARLKAIHRALPFYLDVITLAIESGANLSGAFAHALSKGPGGPLHREIQRMVRDVRAGQSRSDALRAMADRVDLPSVRSWIGALLAAEKHGSSLGTVLRAQAEQRRQERFQLAEKLAMRAPVKMLFPLLCFIFPCTLALLFFPVVVRLVQEGLLQ